MLDSITGPIRDFFDLLSSMGNCARFAIYVSALIFFNAYVEGFFTSIFSALPDFGDAKLYLISLRFDDACILISRYVSAAMFISAMKRI